MDKDKTIVLAVDPGKASGVAIYRTPGREGALPEAWEDPFYDTVSCIDHYCQVFKERLHLVIESYKITASTIKKSRQPTAIEIIGSAKYFTARYGSELKIQDPAPAKRLFPDERLRALGWWTPTQDGHANDALRHLGRYRVRFLGHSELVR